MGYEDSCTTGLSLSLGTQDFPRNHLILNDHHHHQQQQQKKSFIVFDPSIPSLTLGLSSSVSINSKKSMDQEGENPTTNLYRQPSNSIISAVSSFSNSTSVKRERDGSGEEVEMIEKAFNSKASDFDQDEEGGIRKKLRLTKEQSFVLEESFKQHSTLNPKRKQALAKRLNLRPRQVEVWFQNRRARTKLKQNEIECDLLKKCCEALTDDNRRLQKEIQELKALKTTTGPPFYMQFPAATLTMCPSCERISGSGGNDTTSSKSPFSLGPKPYIFNPFTTHPSAAC